MSKKVEKERASRRILVILATLLCISAIAFFARDVGKEISRLDAARSDNIQWTLSQIEVEFLDFRTALAANYEKSDPDLAAVRQEFDVFFSRISTVNNGQMFEGLREDLDFATYLQNVNGFLEITAEKMDASDPVLRVVLPDILQNTETVRPDIRSLANSGIGYFASLADEQRSAFSSALSRLGLIVTGLIVALCLLILYLSWLNAQNLRRQCEVMETNTRIKTITSTSLDGVIVADLNGDILEFNRAAEEIFGHAATDVLGKNIGDVIVPDHFRAGHDAGMKRMQESGEKRVVGHGRVQLEALKKDGEIFPVELAIQSADTEDGELFIAFLRDVSEKVAAEAELIAARDKALEGEKAKGEFMAVMSHEIRTPLNGLLGNLSLLKDTEVGKEQQEYLTNMETSGRLLLSHVTDVLDITRYDAGNIAQNLRPMALAPFLQDLLDSQASQAEKQGTKLSMSWLGAPVETLNSDPDLLQPVLLNLIGNAVKFTKNGEVRLEVEKVGGTTKQPEIEFRVIDDGSGIEPDLLEVIFDDFVTGNISYNRQSGGTGLGLGIAKRYAEALGGSLTVESEVGKGSTFRFRAPFLVEKEMAALDELTLPETTSSQKILVVEDNEINRQVAREMLRKMGHEVTEANDGQEGVAAALAAQFDLILMDITMPIMDGREATRAIRSGEGLSARTPIVALTANVIESDRVAFLEDGMDEVLSKPISRQRLAEVIYGLAKSSEPHLVDQDQLTELLDLLGETKFEETMTKFKAEGHEFLHEMGQKSGDALAKSSHKFAGSAAMLGATELHSALKVLENAAKAEATDDIVGLKASLPDLWENTLANFDAER